MIYGDIHELSRELFKQLDTVGLWNCILLNGISCVQKLQRREVSVRLVGENSCDLDSEEVIANSMGRIEDIV